MNMESTDSSSSPIALSRNQCIGILIVAFLGWFFGGMQIGITGVAMRAAPIELMHQTQELDLDTYKRLQTAKKNKIVLNQEESNLIQSWNGKAAQWFAWYQCAFLFGAALGGFLLGRLGDRIGRTRSLAISISWFAIFTGVSYFSTSPTQLLILRFLACIGIGGTWPNGIALVSEAWSNTARPFVASAIGMAGNLGIFVMFSLSKFRAVTPDDWRWVMVVGAVPVVLGIIIWFLIPESPTWLSLAKNPSQDDLPNLDPTREVFGPKYRLITFVGIALATIPLIGGWGSANWMLPWAGEVGSQIGDETLKADVGLARSLTSIIGSLFAGMIAVSIGRRLTYAITSIGALVIAQYAFWFSTPIDSSFIVWVAILGFFNGVFFGWLPFFLPELFEARVRSTGSGISFNSGRILTAITIFTTGALLEYFNNDYATIGKITSWIFLFGLIAILFTPDTSKKNMET